MNIATEFKCVLVVSTSTNSFDPINICKSYGKSWKYNYGMVKGNN